jgi:hypothetical protein
MTPAATMAAWKLRLSLRSLNLARATLNTVRSRVLLGAGAWLLGAVAATAGSLLAVEQLGQGILAQQSTELSVSEVNARLAAEKGDAGTAPTVRAHPSQSESPTPIASKRHKTSKPVRPARPAQSAGNGRLIPSADGTAFAECRTGGAYLVYWTPQIGFAAAHVVQGPAAVASVTFRNSTDGVVMKVSCQGGAPVAHLTSFGHWHDD